MKESIKKKNHAFTESKIRYLLIYISNIKAACGSDAEESFIDFNFSISNVVPSIKIQPKNHPIDILSYVFVHVYGTRKKIENLINNCFTTQQ